MNRKAIIVLVMSVIIALPVLSIAYADDEPNNDFSHASVLKESATGSVARDDTSDFYKFFVAKGIDIQLEVTADNDVDLYLYNPEYKGVAFSCKENKESISYSVDTTGTWYAEIAATKGTATYDISLLMVPPDDQIDCGYQGDAGNRILKAADLYPMEPIDNTPGRGVTGMLDPDEGDSEDWYFFPTCEGQTIVVTLAPTQDYDLEMADKTGSIIASSTGSSTETITYVSTMTDSYYLHIFAKESAGAGTYTLNIDLQGQNDGNKGQDAGNSIDQAMTLTPGTYNGYMCYTDQVDWYAFNAASGQGIRIELEGPRSSDYNLFLYDPNGNFVYSAEYNGDDTLEYPADVGGVWKLKVDMWPGFDAKWDEYPLPYYKYGSGGYKLTLEVGVSVSPPIVPAPQPDIIPVAQTIVINNDPATNKDEYAYMAAIPATNYIDGGNRYVSPIFYEGDDSVVRWVSTVDQGTNYLVDDWNAYLARHGKEASVYTMGSDPVGAAADLAEKVWESSANAVVVVDGSMAADEVTEVLSKSTSLNIQKNVKQTRGDSDDWVEVAGNTVYLVTAMPKYGVMHVEFTETGHETYYPSVVSPKYRAQARQEWPDNEPLQLWTPISIPGPYGVASDSPGDFQVTVTLYSCDRYKIPVSSSQSTLNVTVETAEDSYLWVYLIDPKGNVMAPNIPSWSGAEVPDYLQMPGNVSQGTELDYAYQVIKPHKTVSAEVNHPLPGKWTAIVVPRWDMTGSIDYTVTGTIRTHSSDRVNYALSAANGAVEASMGHVPLLYTAADGLSERTLSALNNLGVKKVTFVDLAGNDIVANELAANFDVDHQTSMTEVVQAIKTSPVRAALAAEDENYITVTSFATLKGFYAPAAYLAAYHGSPVVDVDEMGEAAHWGLASDRYEEYNGMWYHASLSTGHQAKAGQPIMDYIRNKELPPLGWDQDLLYKSRIAEGFQTYITEQGLDGEGTEFVALVAPRYTDISQQFNRAITGNKSTAGSIFGETPACESYKIVRSVLYPAIIYATEYRNYTTSSLMNYGGATQTTNNGERVNAENYNRCKEAMSLYGREYRGHVYATNLLFELNRGSSLYYYSGHGTGGGGVSVQPEWGYPHMDGWKGYVYAGGGLPRDPSSMWFDVEGNNQYELIHFYWFDVKVENLHSQYLHFSSCTTAWHSSPDTYMNHGAVAYYGNCGTGIGGYNDAWDQMLIKRSAVDNLPLGLAYSIDTWKWDRDYTTLDPTSIYGSMSLNMQSVSTYFGDPALVIYAPDYWTEPIPIDGFA